MKNRYGFDLDNTLDRPAIAQLARDLFAAGHEVHIITAIEANADNARYLETFTKINRLQVPFTKVHITLGYTLEEMGALKANIIEAHGITMMLDDSPTFCREIMLGSEAQVLRVL